MYGLLAYRLPWFGLEPYIEYEAAAKSFTLPRYAGTSRATRSNLMLSVPSAGFNLPLSSQTTLKAQCALLALHEDKDLDPDVGFETPILFTRIVTTF